MLTARLLTAAAVLSLGACSGISYVLENYKGVEKQEIHVEGDDDYRIFDKPDAGRMMVTSSLSSAAGQGAVKGLFLGAVDASPPKPRFQKAAETFLTSTNRPNCRVTDGYLLVSPQWEFAYTCAQPEKVASARGRRG